MSTQLRELFDGAAESQPPEELAARAVAGARRRRTQRYTVAGSVLAAAAVVLGFVMASSSERLDGAPRPNEVAGVPDQLPAAIGLPKLAADTMSSASTAYLVDGEVVVIDAATGEGALVAFRPSPDSPRVGVTPGIGPDASLALSADGRFLMVSSGDPNSEVGSSREWMWMVDVATGTVALQTGIQLAPAGDESPVLLNRMAWSPNGTTFACVCAFSSGRPQLHLMRTSELEAGDLTVNSAESAGVVPTQISWGTDGLVARLPELGGDWRLVPPGDGSMADPKEWPTISSALAPESIDQFVTAVVMGQSRQGGFLGVIKGFRYYWLVNDVDYKELSEVGVRPVLGSLGDSYFAVFTDWKGDPVDGAVTRIDANGETTLTTLPPGSTTVSFASDLVD